MRSIGSQLRDLGVSPDEIREDASPGRDTWPTGLKRPTSGPADTPLVVVPSSVQTIQRILPWAARVGARVQVRGGGTNVVGALDGDVEIVLSMARFDAIRAFDRVSQTVTAEAGVLGERLEGFLGARSFTLGHYPQSLPTSTVGGWIATRATGTASAAHGGIERLVCGIELVLASGELVRIAPRPRAPGGLDAIALFHGSEGSLGVVTQATLSVARQQPERRLAAVFPTFGAGLEAQRSLVQARLPVAVLRVLDATESAAIAPPGSIDPGACLLIASLEGADPIIEAAAALVAEIVRTAGGTVVDAAVADRWWAHRYAAAGLIEERNAGAGAMFDTIEVSTTWSQAASLSAALEAAVAPLVGTLWLHASHAYASGTCLYLAFWIQADDDAAAVRVSQAVWDTTLRVTREHGGSPGHHHGIGAARSEVYADSPEGRLHRAIKGALDPHAVLAARLLAVAVAPVS